MKDVFNIKDDSVLKMNDKKMRKNIHDWDQVIESTKTGMNRKLIVNKTSTEMKLVELCKRIDRKF